MSLNNDVDYTVSQTFSEYYEELEGRIFPFTPIDTKPLNDMDLEDPKIINILEAMSIIRVYDNKKLKGGVRL